MLGAVVYLFEDPRHREDERGPEGAQVVKKPGNVRGMAEHGAGFQAADLDDAGEGMGQRQE